MDSCPAMLAPEKSGVRSGKDRRDEQGSEPSGAFGARPRSSAELWNTGKKEEWVASWRTIVPGGVRMFDPVGTEEKQGFDAATGRSAALTASVSNVCRSFRSSRAWTIGPTCGTAWCASASGTAPFGQLDLAGSGTQEGFESRLTHHCRGVLQPLDQHPHDGDRLVRVDTHIKKYLRVRDGLAVHSGQDRRVGILDPRQADRALQALQQLEVQPGRLADLSRRHANPVLTHHPIRRQQQRSDRGPNPGSMLKPPYIAVFRIVRHIQRAQASAAGPVTMWSPWILTPGLLFPPVLFVYLQRELNKVWAIEVSLSILACDTSREARSVGQ